MSDAVFPVLPGLKWDVKKSPVFKTQIQEAISGRESRAASYLQPLWDFSLGFEVLRESLTELQTLAGFFLARSGQYDSFLYTDPSDSTVVDQQIAIGDGVTRTFQLLRSFGGFVEPVMYPDAVTFARIAGVSRPFTLSAGGVITFPIARTPLVGEVVTWTGSYYFRCRFTQDATEFNQFAYRLWELQQLEFKGCLGDKL